MSRVLSFAVLGGLLVSPPFADALTFQEAIDRAERSAPGLAAARARVGAARSSVIAAGALPDPKLVLGVENLPIEGLDRFSLTRDGMTMQRIGVMQEFPNRGKRRARVALADARVDGAEAERRSAILMVRRDAAVAWIRRWTAERQLLALDAIDADNQLLQATVRAQLASGTATPADALMPRAERLALEEMRDQINAQRSMAVTELQRWVEGAEEPLVGEAPQWQFEMDWLRTRLDRHPALQELDAQRQALDAERDEARAMKRPDWALEVAYQRRAPVFGDMASLMLTIDLPLRPAHRQDPQIAARTGERAALEADREATRRDLEQALRADWIQWQQLGRAVRRLQSEVLPLAEERVALLLSGYRSGRYVLSEVIAARRERGQAHLRLIELQGERDLMAARLRYSTDFEAGDEQ